MKLLISHQDFSESAKRVAVLSTISQGYPTTVKASIELGLSTYHHEANLAESLGVSGKLSIFWAISQAGVDFSRAIHSKWRLLKWAALCGHAAMIEHLAHLG